MSGQSNSSHTQDRTQLAVLVTDQIGETRSLTPEGYLFCESVPIARTGWMIYAPGEVPVPPGPDGLIHVYRGPEVLFNADTIASFQGKAITDLHPTRALNPALWKASVRGVVLNPRQGEGNFADCLVADLLIQDEDLIKQVNTPPGQRSKREISCGYHSTYEIVGDGEANQINILGNHVALVDRGRCGSRCAVGDQAPNLPLEITMAKPTPTTPVKKTIAQSIAALFADMAPKLAAITADEDGEDDDEEKKKAKEKAEMEKATEDSAKRITALEGSVNKLVQGQALLLDAISKMTTALTADEGEDDDEEEKKRKAREAEEATQDSAALATSWKSVMAQAEVLVPGFKVPTFDAAATRAVTIDRMCSVRREALTAAAAVSDNALLLRNCAGLTSDKALDFSTMDCAAVASVFGAAAGAKAAINNARSQAASGAAGSRTTNDNARPKGPQTLAELNLFYKDHYAKQNGRA